MNEKLLKFKPFSIDKVTFVDQSVNLLRFNKFQVEVQYTVLGDPQRPMNLKLDLKDVEEFSEFGKGAMAKPAVLPSGKPYLHRGRRRHVAQPSERYAGSQTAQDREPWERAGSVVK